MALSSAYLLVFHGSRDPRPQIAAERLAHLVRQELANYHCHIGYPCYDRGSETPSLSPIGRATALLSKSRSPLAVRGMRSPRVELASLELTPIPLRDRIEQVAVQARAAGASRLKILPLFLSAGVHVTEDIPSEVAWAQKALRERVRLELQPHVGTYPELAQLLAQRLAQVPTEASILLAHGSRRSGANQAITALAGGLKALPAYWSVEPSLAGQVEVLAGSGKQAIAIVPYFLFSGGITDAIARQIHQLQQKFPHVAFKLAEPLGATPEFAHLLVKRMER